MPTPISDLVRRGAERLAAAGVASPRVDAELLLAHLLGIERSRLPVVDPPDDTQVAAFQTLLRRRAEREPLQHLLGSAAFRYLLLAVGPGVFVPRPETELLIDAVLPTLRSVPHPIAVDLCSGSGALALALVTEAESASVVAVERSASALGWLRRNAAQWAPGPRLRVVAGDLLDPRLLVESDALGDLVGRVDVVVSNPPYVPLATSVGPEVGHDPDDAVFAGGDGLGLIPAVLRVAAALLRPGGVLAMEHDDTHAESVPALMSSAGTDSMSPWRDVRDHLDLTGRPRFVTATRS